MKEAILGFHKADLLHEIRELGLNARADMNADDLRLLKSLKTVAICAQLIGRGAMIFVPGFWGAFMGTSFLAFYLSLEAQLNHSIMHGAYADQLGVGRYTPSRYETLALPFQTQTWRDAHRIHHANPSVVGQDPDTVHSLFRVHLKTRWRFWHIFNSFIGAFLTFELWAFEYDHFLKLRGRRPTEDRGEVRKFLIFIFYQYFIFTTITYFFFGQRYKQVLVATFIANVIRNFVFTGLQLASSVGATVSTAHADRAENKAKAESCKFQIETSKNFVIKSAFWRKVCGGLDRHIEHHLYPNLPPNRLYQISKPLRQICAAENIRYTEFSSFGHSLRDSVSYLLKLSWR